MEEHAYVLRPRPVRVIAAAVVTIAAGVALVLGARGSTRWLLMVAMAAGAVGVVLGLRASRAPRVLRIRDADVTLDDPRTARLVLAWDQIVSYDPVGRRVLVVRHRGGRFRLVERDFATPPEYIAASGAIIDKLGKSKRARR